MGHWHVTLRCADEREVAPVPEAPQLLSGVQKGLIGGQPRVRRARSCAVDDVINSIGDDVINSIGDDVINSIVG